MSGVSIPQAVGVVATLGALQQFETANISVSIPQAVGVVATSTTMFVRLQQQL